MNFRRGLFRIWLILTVLWLVFIGSFAYYAVDFHPSDASEQLATPDAAPSVQEFVDTENDGTASHSGLTLDQARDYGAAPAKASKTQTLDDFMDGIASGRTNTPLPTDTTPPATPPLTTAKIVLKVAGLAVLPPFGILVLGWLLVWAVAGFTPRNVSRS